MTKKSLDVALFGVMGACENLGRWQVVSEAEKRYQRRDTSGLEAATIHLRTSTLRSYPPTSI